MSRGNFEWWRFLAGYCLVFFIIYRVTAILEKEIGAIGGYLILLAILLVSANLYYRVKRKNAMTQEASGMSRWDFEWWEVLMMYCVIDITNRVMDILKEIGIGGYGYLTILIIICLAYNRYDARKEKRGGRRLKERMA